MKEYALELASDGSILRIFADCDEDAIENALTRMGLDDDAVVVSDWHADGQNDDGEPMRRVLIWANEGDAKDDAGAKSYAQLSTTGRHMWQTQTPKLGKE